MPPRSYGWFDAPDGQDIIKKTSLASRVGFVVGMPFALFDHCLNRQQTLKTYAFRASACILPFVGAGAAFALTSQTLCQKYPKTRPEFWYMAGGAAAGTVIGAAAKSPMAGSVCTFYFAIAAAIVRELCGHELDGYIANLPKQLNNDDEWFTVDYRINPQPMSHMPPPMARPSKPHSDLAFY